MTKPIKIIVFGCDNSGKTTLVNKIAEKFPEAKIVKSLGPATYNKQIEYIEHYVIQPEFLIFDRFPIIEEFTCGEVLRNSNNFSKINPTWANFVFDEINLLIYCNPGMNNILNWGDREQMEGIKENIEKLNEAYLQLPQKLNTTLQVNIENKLIRYNWETDDVEEIFRRIENEYKTC